MRQFVMCRYCFNDSKTSPEVEPQVRQATDEDGKRDQARTRTTVECDREAGDERTVKIQLPHGGSDNLMS